MSNEDRTFKVKLNASKSKPIKVQLNKTSSVLRGKTKLWYGVVPRVIIEVTSVNIISLK